MAQKSISGSDALAKQIKSRRNELGLTIEEAARRAGVGMKTWSRYEAGGSIRADKCKGLCKALNWLGFPSADAEEGDAFPAQEHPNHKGHEAWSQFLEEHFGADAAMSFAAGSDILYDHIQEDISELASMPTGSHVGQLDISYLFDILPEQFRMQYDYTFLYHMKCTLSAMRARAQSGRPMTAHSVMEELLLYLCAKEALILLELRNEGSAFENSGSERFVDWVFDLFDDMDIITYLYSDVYLEAEHPYHFSHWFADRFYAG